jgi:hypothetical protein
MSVELTVALVSSVFTAIVGPIAVHLLKEKLEKNKKNKKDLLKESIENNTLIFNKVEVIKEEYKADRVWITQFHNGGTFYPTGKSIQKFSMFYETVSQDTESIQQSFQQIPISLFSKSINHLLEDDMIAIPNFKDETIATYGLKYVAEESGCKSGYLFAIKTIDNKFIGILGVDYVKRKHVLTSDEINELLIEASAIGGVLNKSLV